MPIGSYINPQSAPDPLIETILRAVSPWRRRYPVKFGNLNLGIYGSVARENLNLALQLRRLAAAI
jgi:hypothetical protein